MSEHGFSDGLLIGLLIGLLVGFPIGWLIMQTVSKPAQTAPSSVIFDRDKDTNLITAIHYVPVKG